MQTKRIWYWSYTGVLTNLLNIFLILSWNQNVDQITRCKLSGYDAGLRLEYRLSFWTIARVGIGNVTWHWFLGVHLSEYDVGIKLEHWLFFSTYVFILVHGTVCMRSCSLVLYVSLCHLPKRIRCWSYIGPLTFVLDTCLILSWNHSVTLIGQCILGGYDIGPVLEH